ncbi:delta-60 repeat domain-containing protein [Corallococcus terminator]
MTAFTLTGPSELSVGFAPGNAKRFSVQVVREGSFTGPVVLSLEGLPTHVGADALSLSVPEGENVGGFVLHVQEAAAYGRFPIRVVGEGQGERVELPVMVEVQPGQGALDVSLGSAGLALPALGQGPLRVSINAMAVQPDGTWVLAGSTGSTGSRDVLVARLLPDGTPDVSFGTQGTRVIDVCGGDDYVDAVTVLSDGRIVLAGGAISDTNSCTARNYQSLLLVRLTDTGALDTTFGTNGVRTFQLSAGNAALHALAVDSRDRIVGAGTVQNTDRDQVLVRLLPTGQLDTTFSGDGLAWEDIGGDDEGLGVVALLDDALLLAGTTASHVHGLTLRRYQVNGERDRTFNYAPPAHSTPKLTPRTLHLLEGGKLLVGTRAVFSSGASDTAAGLLLVGTTGALETSFGTLGSRYFVSVEGQLRDVLVGTGLLPGGEIALSTVVRDAAGEPGLGLIHVSADGQRELRKHRSELPGSERPTVSRLDAEGFFRVAGLHTAPGQAVETPFVARFWPY